MIISDLSHFEEVVFEAPSIVGGTTTTAFSTSLPSSLLRQLSPQLRALLRSLRGRVITVNLNNRNGSASVTTGVFRQGNLNVSFAASSSASN